MDVFYTDSSPQLKAYAKADVDKRISELEKQLAEALAENAALVAEFQRLADEPPTLEEIAADLDKIEMLEKQLAEAQTEVERQTDRIMGDACIISAAALAIAERDKLIEQLKKALESAKLQHYVNDDDNWYSCPASGLCSNGNAGTDCNCGADHINSIIEAALEAAERGEG